jgi:hypothetical protein
MCIGFDKVLNKEQTVVNIEVIIMTVMMQC